MRYKKDHHGIQESTDQTDITMNNQTFGEQGILNHHHHHFSPPRPATALNIPIIFQKNQIYLLQPNSSAIDLQRRNCTITFDFKSCTVIMTITPSIPCCRSYQDHNSFHQLAHLAVPRRFNDSDPGQERQSLLSWLLKIPSQTKHEHSQRLSQRVYISHVSI